MEELAPYLTAINGSAFTQAMRGARWLYPAVNTGHIIGLALVVGAILPLDLRLMGFWRSVPTGPLARVLVPVSMFGVLLTVVTGAMLFATDAVKYANMTLFQVKMGLVVLAISNALVLRGARDWPPVLGTAFLGTTGHLKWAGFLSALCWISALVCGRMIAYI